MPRIRQRVHYAGRVQGVGFRATACQLARRFDVAGSVRNLPDGRVEVVVEGEPTETAAFLAALDSAFDGFIQETQVSVEPPSGESVLGFSIRP